MAKKKLLLFDPITSKRRIVTYSEVCQMVNSSRPNIVVNYTHKIKLRKINCYLLDEDTPDSDLLKLMAEERIKDEVWRDIKGTNIQWQVSSYGRYRHRRSRNGAWKYSIIKPDTSGYPRIQITIDGKCQCLRAHKLVAEYFIGRRPSNKHCIMRIVQDSFNNRVDNLYYGLTVDMLNSTSRGSFGVVFKIHPETGKIMDEYENISDAARDNFTTKSNIRDAITGYGHRVSAVGYVWAYEKDYKKKIEFEEEV